MCNTSQTVLFLDRPLSHRIAYSSRSNVNDQVSTYVRLCWCLLCTCISSLIAWYTMMPRYPSATIIKLHFLYLHVNIVDNDVVINLHKAIDWSAGRKKGAVVSRRRTSRRGYFTAWSPHTTTHATVTMRWQPCTSEYNIRLIRPTWKAIISTRTKHWNHSEWVSEWVDY